MPWRGVSPTLSGLMMPRLPTLIGEMCWSWVQFMPEKGGMPLQLAVIEDQAEYMKGMSPKKSRNGNAPRPFQVIINSSIAIVENTAAQFFEGCSSVAGFSALVPRARRFE